MYSILWKKESSRPIHNIINGFIFLLIAANFPGSYSAALDKSKAAFNPISLYDEAIQKKNNGNYEKAINLLNEYLAQPSIGRLDQLSPLLNLALLYWNIGDLERSNKYYSKAITLAHNLKQKDLEDFAIIATEIYSSYQEGKAYRASEEYKKSIQAFDKAIILSERIRSPEHRLKCMRQLSLTYWDLNDFDRFYQLNKESLDIARKIGHKKEQGRCLNNIGTFYYRYDNYTEALSSYEMALQIAKDLKSLVDLANTLLNIGAVWSDIGDYEKSLEYLREALNIDTQLEDPNNVAKDLNNIGISLRLRGIAKESDDDLKEAIATFERSLRIIDQTHDHLTRIQILNNLGSVYIVINQPSKALEAFMEAASIAERENYVPYLSMIFNNIGIAYSNLGNLKASFGYYDKALKFASIYQNETYIWETYLELGNSHKKQKKYGEAIADYKNAISSIENIRSKIVLEELRARYLGTDKRIEAYQNLIALLVKLHRINPAKRYDREAFNYLERAKARAFLDSLEISKIDISQGINPIQANHEKELMRDLSRAYNKLLAPDLSQGDKEGILNQIKTSEDELESLKRDIRMSSPAYADLKYPEVITYEEVLRDLKARDVAFFAYSVGKEASYAFVISSHGLKIFDLPPKEVLQKQVIEYRKAISDRQSQNFHLGMTLFQELIEPGLEQGVKKLIIVPDDILTLFPFETLLTRAEPASWLIQDYMIGYVPSLSSLRVLKQRYHAEKIPEKDLLAIGDVLYRSNDENGKEGASPTSIVDLGSAENVLITHLRYSALEVQNIAHLFKQAKVTVLEKENASERWLKSHALTDYRIIHFATHSLIDDKKPARSAILLSYNPAQGEDGLLQAREVYNLKLNADLVTLSACQTGLGQFIRGEGIEGLNRAFFYAGTSSILMSLWAVNDQATFHLMERFYRHIQRGESLAGSLREAKLEMIHSHILSHPYYWAGFVINGKTDSRIYSGVPDLGILGALFGVALAVLLAIGLYRRL
jgi:CHAT domain-containing protein/Tfp pilus assembly protein PilF